MLRFAHVFVALALGAAAAVLPAASHPGSQVRPAPPVLAGYLADQRADAREQLAAVHASTSSALVRQVADERAAQQAAQQAAQEAAAARARATAQSAPAAPAAAPTSYPPGSIQQVIVTAFQPYGDAAVQWGLRVARCESGYNPRAYNPAGPYYGLFQFLMSTFKNTPYGNGDIYDPVANANAAAWKYANGGASAWGCR